MQWERMKLNMDVKVKEKEGERGGTWTPKERKKERELTGYERRQVITRQKLTR